MIRTNYKSNQQRMNILTGKHIAQSNAMAYSFYRTTGISLDELRSVASLALCEAANKFDPRRSLCLSTLVHHTVRNNLIKFVGHSRKHVPISPENEAADFVEPSRVVEFADCLGKLGKEAGEMVKIILSGPAEILDIAIDASPCKIRKALREYMVWLGYSKDEVAFGMNEIKSILN